MNVVFGSGGLDAISALIPTVLPFTKTYILTVTHEFYFSPIVFVVYCYYSHITYLATFYIESQLMTIKEKIEIKINKIINPQLLEVIDESHKHAGHVGAKPEGETHFHINMTANEFDGMNRVQRQRLVYKALAEELAGPVHALSLSLKGSED